MKKTVDKNDYKFIPIPYLIDRKLYKYYGNVSRAIDSVKHRRIHLDNPQTFNDPFEAAFSCYHYSQLPISDTKRRIIDKINDCVTNAFECQKHKEVLLSIRACSLDEWWQSDEMILVSDAIKHIYNALGEVPFSFDEFCEIIDQGFLEIGSFLHVECKISCFSEIKDSVLMWSYYANSHKGVCIEYDLSKLECDSYLNKQILNNLSKVHYSPIRADNLHTGMDDNSYLNFLTSKADVWSHEHEWRIICETEEEFLPLDCISAIYVGVKFDTNTKNYINLIKAADTYNSIKIYKCKLNQEEYKIDFEEIYDSVYGQLLNEKRKDVSEKKEPQEIY